MQIDGSIALVTGAARRIGREIALELARRGARLAVHYRLSEPEAMETVRQIRAMGADAERFQAELVDEVERTRMMGEIVDRFGGLQILVNNASVFAPGTIEDSTPDLWDDQMDANAKAPFFLAQLSSREMLKAGAGKIVNIADPAGETIWTQYFPYSVSKAALLAVTRGLSRSLAPSVQVNAVSPGPVHFPDHYTEEQKKSAIERTLLKRAGSMEDVVRAVIFLIENDYITGEVIHVDGGRHIM
jgi:NAD(P)-dependent dehydrogenase (short-subunit alcohol dehydrogenase family)